MQRNVQLRAGYVLSAVRKRLLDGTRPDYGRAVLEHLTAFELEVDAPGDPVGTNDPLLAVASNLITRGLPTLPSLRVERELVESAGLTVERSARGQISFPFSDPLVSDDIHLLHRALAPVRHDLEPAALVDASSPLLDSAAERAFLGETLPRLVGTYAPRLAWPQRPVETLLSRETAQEFPDQRTDFSFSFPSHPDHPSELVVEVDGAQHEEAGQRRLDRARDEALREAGCRTVRIPAGRVHDPPPNAVERIKRFFEHPYARALDENTKRPLFGSDVGRAWLRAALVPVHAARLQSTLLWLILSGYLDPEASSWRIAVLERDVPGARLALKDLEELLGNLFRLEGRGRRTPEIDLRVYAGRIGALFTPGGEAPATIPTSDPFEADLLLDTSLFGRPTGPDSVEDAFAGWSVRDAVLCTLRTAFAPHRPRTIRGGRPITYDLPDPPGAREVGYEAAEYEPRLGPLVYLLQNLFRKERFRPHQVDVLCRTLRGESVIGLLPTGAGKSLTYQLSGLLQPGTACVVAPLKSLMRDQHANLGEEGIDATAFINSSLTADERSRVQRGLREGRFQFVFVSPERFLIEEFRRELAEMHVPISYCVIDEVHCVSEWGHDFRTAYLRLAENARTHCPSRWPEGLPLIGLTGTASYDVLSDVRRELEPMDGSEERIHLISPESFQRSELHFEIRPVEPPAVLSSANEWDVREAVIEKKLSALGAVLREMPEWCARNGGHPVPEEDFFRPREENTASGLVFTPHANGKFGVREVAGAITRRVGALEKRIDCFTSSDEQSTEEDLVEIQEEYKKNRLSALVATKAFGMGIDKPNIRYVVHTNMSQSIESYYQEAGRAGRDRDPARCVILYCDQRSDGPGRVREGGVSVDQELMLYFHRQSFKGKNKEKRVLYDLLRGDARPEMADHPDLEALVEDMRLDDPPQLVTIDFSNRELRKEIVDLLQEEIDERFEPWIVRTAIDRCRRANDFPKHLNGAYKDVYDRWPSEYLSSDTEGGPGTANPSPVRRLETLFERLRDEQDTFKAVYRLSLIGLIEDYTVDYRQGVVRARIRKRTPAGYVEELQNYVARYVAPEQARRVPEEVSRRSRHDEKRTIRGCLDHLVDFAYHTIARKRRTAIRTMEEAVREGAERGSAAFIQRVTTYFDSRYLPELQPAFPERSFDLELVWDFAERTEGGDDNLNHLRGACDRLLADHPESGALYLLRAFTRLLLPGNPDHLIRSDFREGWRLMREEGGLSRQGHLGALSRFDRILGQYDTRATGWVRKEMARSHAAWLRSFNEQFLAGYHA